MCLAIPSKVIKISDNVGVIDTDGVKREVSLLLLDDVAVGDYVIIHAGFAINKIDEHEAAQTLKSIREAVALMDENS